MVRRVRWHLLIRIYAGIDGLIARKRTFTYDNLNCLITAQSQVTSGSNCWGQSIPMDSTGYDRWGNMACVVNAQK